MAAGLSEPRFQLTPNRCQLLFFCLPVVLPLSHPPPPTPHLPYLSGRPVSIMSDGRGPRWKTLPPQAQVSTSLASNKMRARPLRPFWGGRGQSDIDRGPVHRTHMDINGALLHGVHVLLIFTKKALTAGAKEERESPLAVVAELRQPPSVSFFFFCGRGRVLRGAPSNRQSPLPPKLPNCQGRGGGGGVRRAMDMISCK